MEKINEAWKNASEEMYKAQLEGAQAQPGADAPEGGSNTADDAVEDVDFEEVIEMNVKKLEKRYPGGEFDIHKSENRAANDL